MQSQSHSDAIMDLHEKIEDKQTGRDCEQLTRELHVASYDPRDTYDIRDPYRIMSILELMRSRL